MIQQWLIDNALSLVAILVGGIVMINRSNDKTVALEAKVDQHIASGHPSCPVHDGILGGIQRSIDELKAQVTILDGRIYSFIRNGSHHDKD